MSKMMKSFMIPVMAVAAIASAVPAVASAQAGRPAAHSAQAYGPQAYGARKVTLERKIDRAVSQRRLDVRKGHEFKRELTQISRQEREFSRGGLNRQERQQLDRRYDRLEAQVDREMRNDRHNDRGDRRDHRDNGHGGRR